MENNASMDRNPEFVKRPWSVDRWGRLLAGSSILLMTALGVVHHPAWLIGTLLASVNFVITSLTNRCVLHDLLIWAGAKEREDLFLPGGSVRPECAKNPWTFAHQADETEIRA